MSWYYEIDRQQLGPVSDEEFAAMVQAGTIRPESLVWKQGWPEWRAYNSVTGVNAEAAGSADADTAVCAVSGRRLPKSQMLEFEGRWVGVEHKDEFFQRLREGVNIPHEMVYATFGRRFGAKLIDGLIIGGITVVINMALAFAMIGSVTATGNTDGATGMMIAHQVFSNLVSIGLGLGYSIYFVRKNNATPGKKILGLNLVRADGSKLSTGRIVGRYFAEWVSSMILFIGYLMAAFDKEQRRTLHDRMCDTRVIDVRGL